MRWREDVEFEYRNGMRTDRFILDVIDTEVGEFMADTSPKFVHEYFPS